MWRDNSGGTADTLQYIVLNLEAKLLKFGAFLFSGQLLKGL
jgi:hypothetical protein